MILACLCFYRSDGGGFSGAGFVEDGGWAGNGDVIRAKF
jgi:hypothetical protein